MQLYRNLDVELYLMNKPEETRQCTTNSALHQIVGLYITVEE